MDDVIIYSKEILETLKLAETLDNKQIIILFTKHDTKNKELLKTLQEQTNLQLTAGLLVKNVKEAQKYAAYYVLFGEATRDLIESKLVKYIFNAEIIERKDKTHRRGSGMNQVIAKLLVDKEKTYCFNLRILLCNNQAQLLGRIEQNKRILKKYDCKTVCYSFAEKPLELRAKKERKLLL